MPPKQRLSKSRVRSRRANFYSSANIGAVTVCPKCGEPLLRHRVCLNCGYYAGKQIIEVEEKE